MLTTRTKKYLEGLSYDPMAERIPCIVPLGGIYWRDEIPDFDRFLELPESDQNSILRLFSIRFQIWASKDLSEEDASYWKKARSLFPRCPIFQRLKLSPEDQAAQDEAHNEALEFFDAMLAGASEITLTESNGIATFSATHKLTDEEE